MCGGILGNGAIKCAEDVIVAVYLLDRDLAPVYPRKVPQHVLQDLHQQHPPQTHARSNKINATLNTCTIAGLVIRSLQGDCSPTRSFISAASSVPVGPPPTCPNRGSQETGDGYVQYELQILHAYNNTARLKTLHVLSMCHLLVTQDRGGRS